MFHPPSATFTPSLELCAGAQTFYPGEASCHITSTQESRASFKVRYPPDPGPFIHTAARLILTYHPGNMYAAAPAFYPDRCSRNPDLFSRVQPEFHTGLSVWAGTHIYTVDVGAIKPRPTYLPSYLQLHITIEKVR